MPGQPPATTYRPEMEARFKALAENRPALTRQQVGDKLAQDPPIDPKVYYTWLGQYATSKAKQSLAKGPVSSDTITRQLQDVHYDDPDSIFSLIMNLGSPTGVQRISFGTYQPSGSQQKFTCFLQPEQGTLPQDLDRDEWRGNANVTQAKYSATGSRIPEFFVQIGNLCTSKESSPKAESATKTEFVVGVTPTDRQVHLFWNPLGVTPQTLDGSDPKSRQSVGSLPGFTNKCTAVRLGITIDDLLQNPTRALSIGTDSFLNLSSGATISFGGVDRDGWTRLDKVSSKFAAVKRYSGEPARGG